MVWQSLWKIHMPETFLTVKEVARRLAVGRTTVYELIARQELMAIKIGRARRIPESALERWIAQQLTDKEVEYGQTRKP